MYWEPYCFCSLSALPILETIRDIAPAVKTCCIVITLMFRAIVVSF